MATSSFASRRPEILLAVLLSACLVVLSLQVRRPNGRTVGEEWLLSAISPAVTAITSTRAAAGAVSEWMATRSRLLDENRALRADVERLSGEVFRLRDSERDRVRLLELFGAYPYPPAGTHPARLVAVESSGRFRAALLDRGASDGIQVGGVVVAAEGLIGRVVALGARTSRVQLLSDGTAAVGVLFVKGARTAVAHGDGKGGVEVLYVPTIEHVETGDPLVTSGTDGIYPAALPVGRVAALARGPSLFWDMQVGLAADPRRGFLVFVLPPLRKADVPPGGVTSFRP
jgi:rod shape-determining protein MreC